MSDESDDESDNDKSNESDDFGFNSVCLKYSIWFFFSLFFFLLFYYPLNDKNMGKFTIYDLKSKYKTNTNQKKKKKKDLKIEKTIGIN